jgi:hypothetical protein
VANILSSNRFLAVQIYSTTEEIRFATDGLTPRNVNGWKTQAAEGKFHKEKRIQYFSQANTQT